MKQIDYKYYGEFYKELSEEDKLLRYAVTGGVPKYIELFSGSGDIMKLVEKHVLDTGSFLYEEPEFLLRNEIKEVGRYFTILKTIAGGKRKLSEICASCEMTQSSIMAYIKVLIDLDIVARDVPVTEKNPEKSKMGQYRIIDNYIFFWFRFVYPYRALIERGQTKWVLDQIKKPLKDNHISFVYEDVCRDRVFDELSEEYGIAKIGKWWDNKNGEIDIVGLSEDTVILGECKYSKKEKGMAVLNDLMNKAPLVKWGNDGRKEIYVIFSRSGFDRKLTEYAATREDVYLLQ